MNKNNKPPLPTQPPKPHKTMDPKNREIIAQMLISTVKNANVQYVVITPSQVTFAKDNVNIITVQNVEGKSIIKEVA
jgi:chromosome segregation ATPase